MTTKGLLVRLQSKAGQQRAIEEILRHAVASVLEGPGATAWFALRFGRHDYGFFAAFPDDSARAAYVVGSVVQSLVRESDHLLEEPPALHELDVLAQKLPVSLPAQPDTRGLLLTFKAPKGREADVVQFLQDAQALVMEEPETTAWFAIHLDSGVYGIFDTFPDNGARLKHLVGHVPRELAKNALHLLGSMPDMEMLDVMGAKVRTAGA